MTRPVPPPDHTRKLRELLAADLLSCMDERYGGGWLALVLRTGWQPDQPLPHGATTLYLRLRGITAPGARPALYAALHGRRVCPPGAAYAPSGWREFIEEEAAKAAKGAR